MSRAAHHKNKEANFWQDKYDEVIAAKPPRIVWRKGNDGIFRAISVRDPHAEARAQRDWDDRMAREEARLAVMEEEACEAAEQAERLRADNTPLMAAARTEL